MTSSFTSHIIVSLYLVCHTSRRYNFNLHFYFLYNNYYYYFLLYIAPCWISTAHRNGVKVLGTFITEWQEGIQENLLLLYNDSYMITCCQKLVSIAKFYGFDGWFINIESPIPKGTIPPTRFATFLSTLTKMVHKELPDEPLVIWYDSLTVHGNVSWQNGLTNENSLFFNSCDGIFLNYCWNVQKLQDSINLCQKLARNPCEIFVGVDIFGRNCYGGFDTYKSLDLIDTCHPNLSIGIFAPGWTFEKALEINAKKSSRQQQILYEQNENLLWLGNFKGRMHVIDPDKSYL